MKIEYRRVGGLGRVNLSQLFNMTLDTLAIFYRASFWRWLNPSFSVQVWMGMFVLGVFLAGVGFAKLLTPTLPQGLAKQFYYIVLLQFIPTPARDWLVLSIGIAFVIFSLVQLNKVVMNAFGKRDRDGISGIRRK